jgi:hypothetical protein
LGNQWLQIASARRFPDWTGSPTGQVAPTQPRTYCYPGRRQLAEVLSGGAAVTISTIHRVSLSTHDLAKAQQFFEAQLGLGRAVKVDEQTLAFGSGSRGLRIKKPKRLLTRTTSEIHGRRSRSA